MTIKINCKNYAPNLGDTGKEVYNMDTKQLIEQWPGLSQEQREFFILAISTRGKRKGYLLANSPKSNTGDKFIAWQSLVGNLAPSRLATFSVMMMNDSDRAKYRTMDSIVMNSGFKFALNACEPPYRWNLWANRYDVDKARALVKEHIAKQEKRVTP